MHSVCIVELHVNANNMKVWSVEQKWTLQRICIAGNNNTRVGVHVNDTIHLLTAIG